MREFLVALNASFTSIMEKGLPYSLTDGGPGSEGVEREWWVAVLRLNDLDS